MTTGAIEREELFGHPKGLYILFFTELWERFSYYGMRALLVLYIIAQVKENDPMGGLGWTQEEALSLYGTYTMSVYLASVPGGIIADKLWGQKKSVFIGGLTLCAGHLVLALPGIAMFYTGLALIVIGVGLLKPNISTMVGGLYREGDPRRDKGFNIFYMGINIGAVLSGIVVGTVGEVYGWHYGFGLAGIGMLAGQAVFMWGKNKHLHGVGDLVTADSIDPRAAAAAKRDLTKEERDRVLVLFLSFFIVIVFWGAFEQAGGLMNIYAKEKTDLDFMGLFEVKATWFQSLNPAYIILLAVPIANFWIMWGKKKPSWSSSLFKMGLGTAIMGWGFIFMFFAAKQSEVGDKAWMGWLILAYLFHTIGELCASPVALSFITKLAPLKYGSLMMGAYFAATGLGNKVAGLVGEAAVGGAGESTVFMGVAIFCSVVGVIVIAALKPLERLTHGAENITDDPVETSPEVQGEEAAEGHSIGAG